MVNVVPSMVKFIFLVDYLIQLYIVCAPNISRQNTNCFIHSYTSAGSLQLNDRMLIGLEVPIWNQLSNKTQDLLDIHGVLVE